MGLQTSKFNRSADKGAPGSALLPKDKKEKLKSIMKMKRMSTIGLRGINKSIAHTFDFKDLKEMQKEDDTMSTKTESDLHGRSLCIFGKHNWLRKIIKQLVSFSYFDYFILVAIVVSSITLALENPLDDPDSRFSKDLEIMNLTMTIIFVIEFLLKIIATGFVFNGKNSYIRNPWNVLDFCSVTISWVGVFTVSNLSVFKVIRVLRLLRPLRVIQRNEGLKVAVQALFMAIPNILYVSMIAVLFFSIFGMTGVNIFKGKFHSWEGIDDKDILIKVDDKYDCLNLSGVWMNADANFDNIIFACRALFEMSTTEGWVDIMNLGIDARGVDLQPKVDKNKMYSLYFIMFIIIGSFFILNLFVGVVISTFNSEKENLGRNYLLTSTQKEWINTRFNIVKMKPLKIAKYSKRPCNRIINHKLFDIFIMACIVMNTVVLALNWYRRPDIVKQISEIINLVFTIVFTIEAAMKIVGLGFKKYFSDGWNIFDFIILLGSYIGMVVEQTTSVSVGVQTLILRAFRISRMLRLVKRAKSLNIIFETFIITIPALANIGGLLLLFLYLYSIIGVQLFAPVMLQDDLNDHTNFQTFFRSFMTLFRASTGEGWNEIMHDISRDRNPLFQCIDDPTYDDYIKYGKAVGCGNFYGQIFLTSFILIVQLIFLNLFIAIILQGFDFMNKKANMILTDNDLLNFKDEWAKFDPKGTGFILYDDLKPFLKNIGSPLGFDSITVTSKERQREFIWNLDFWTYSKVKYYNFYDILRKLSKHLLFKIKLENEKNLNIKTGKRIFNKLRSELDFENTDDLEQIEAIKSLVKNEGKIDKHIEKLSDKFTPLHYKAAFIILGFYRRYKRHTRVRRTSSIRRLLEDKIQDLEEPDDGFRKDKKGDRFVNVILNTAKLQLQHSNINKLLKASLTVIEEDFNSKKNESSKNDDSSSRPDMSSNQKLSSNYLLTKSKTKRISNTGSDLVKRNSSRSNARVDRDSSAVYKKSLLAVSERPHATGNKNSMMSMIEDNNRSFVSNSINLDSAITPSDRKGSSRINLEDFELNPGYSKLTPDDKFQRQVHNKLSTHKPSR